MTTPTPTSLSARLTTTTAASMLLWISRTVLGLLVVFPLVAALQASGMLNGPEGEAVLFRPGSVLLLELLRVAAPALLVAAKLALLLFGGALILELVPLALALDLLWLQGHPFSARVARSLGFFGRFLKLGGIALLAQAALLLAASLISGALKGALEKSDERWLGLAPNGVLVLGLLGCVYFGAVLDVARAAVVQRDLSAKDGLYRALSCVRERPLAVLFGMYPSVAGSAFAYLAALWFTARLDLSGSSHLALAWAFGANQAAALFAIAWRVRWLGRALELSAED
jgi:hypothetical protein